MVENLEFSILNGKNVEIKFTDSGVTIDSDCNLTEKELHYISSVMFVYLAGKMREVPLDLDYVFETADELHEQAELGRHPRIRKIEEMSLREFNDEMRYY